MASELKTKPLENRSQPVGEEKFIFRPFRYSLAKIEALPRMLSMGVKEIGISWKVAPDPGKLAAVKKFFQHLPDTVSIITFDIQQAMRKNLRAAVYWEWLIDLVSAMPDGVKRLQTELDADFPALLQMLEVANKKGIREFALRDIGLNVYKTDQLNAVFETIQTAIYLDLSCKTLWDMHGQINIPLLKILHEKFQAMPFLKTVVLKGGDSPIKGMENPDLALVQMLASRKYKIELDPGPLADAVRQRVNKQGTYTFALVTHPRVGAPTFFPNIKRLDDRNVFRLISAFLLGVRPAETQSTSASSAASSAEEQRGEDEVESDADTDIEDTNTLSAV